MAMCSTLPRTASPLRKMEEVLLDHNCEDTTSSTLGVRRINIPGPRHVDALSP